METNKPDNIILFPVSKKSHSEPLKRETTKETMAEMFKRHKVVVPSDLIFKYK